MERRSLLRSTLRALVLPRRLVPILLVAIPLVIAQARLSAEPWAAPLGIAMCVTFFLLAPVSWRALFRDDEPGARTFAAPFGRLVVFGVAGAGSVLTVGSFVPRALGLGPTLMTSDVSLAVSIALFWVGGYGLGRDIDLERILARERARASSLAAEAEHAQLLALRAHLDPHFLFNTLNAIAEWCQQDPATAERATLMLSDMLRSVLDATRRAAWPLQRELELARTLLRLHLVRDPELFTLRDRMRPPLPHLEVPPMVLLPLVENAVKHGPAAGHRGDLDLKVETDGDWVRLHVENPGPFLGPRRGGEGLPLVRKRLDVAYAGRAAFEIRGHGPRTRASVSIPTDRPRPEVNA